MARVSSKLTVFTWLTLAACAAVLQTGPSAQSRPPFEGVTAFTGARVIVDPRKPPIDNAVLLVRDGWVVAVGSKSDVNIPVGSARQDLSGRTVIPGFVNAHGHVGETKGLQAGAEFYTRDNVLSQLSLYARYGVTTVFSLGGDRAEGVKIRDEQSVPSLRRARLFVAGPVITAETPDEAKQAVAKAAAMNVDIIKIRVDDNLGTTKKMAPDVWKAVIDEAHAQKRRLAVHMFYLDDAKALLAAGADFLAHSVRDKEVDDELIGMMKKRNACISPTLTREVSTFVYEKTPDFFTDPFFTRDADPAILTQLQDPKRQETVRNSRSAQQYKVALEMASRNLKKLQDAGVGIAFGTDSGPPARFQGYFEHLELELMVKAGLTPAQALTAATSGAADCMEVDHKPLTGVVGSLVPGAWADFIVLQKNPLDDIRNTHTIESVWIAGNRLDR
jgi:imidazolonepropionase-like amidohydrolase